MALYGAVAKQDPTVELKLAGDNYTAVAADATADLVAIDTGLGEIDSFTMLILRSDVAVYLDQNITVSAGVITVADGAATYVVTTGDVFYWTAVGR